MILKLRTTLTGSNYKYFDCKGEINTILSSRPIEELDNTVIEGEIIGNKVYMPLLLGKGELNSHLGGRNLEAGTRISQSRIEFTDNADNECVVITDYYAWLLNDKGGTVDKLHSFDVY